MTDEPKFTKEEILVWFMMPDLRDQMAKHLDRIAAERDGVWVKPGEGVLDENSTFWMVTADQHEACENTIRVWRTGAGTEGGYRTIQKSTLTSNIGKPVLGAHDELPERMRTAIQKLTILNVAMGETVYRDAVLAAVEMEPA